MNVEIYIKPSEAGKNVDNAIKEFLTKLTKIPNGKLEYEWPDVEFIRIRNVGEPLDNGQIITQDMWEHANYLTVTLSEGSALELCNDGDGAVASHNWLLPNRDFDGLWESVHYEGDMKERLMRYAITSLKLSHKGVDPHIIGCNRLILLHGPPGTGKTTLCKAIAQQISIRMINNFPFSQLVEINCHSLFSKWFSESGKLVSKMFATIKEYASDSQVLVIVLIDEVESLTAARDGALNRNEPSDAIRVVNAVLTQLDTLRFFNNVFILATSNLPKAIDAAFSDRADIIQYVGLPGPIEITLILESCFQELERIGIFPSGCLKSRKLLHCLEGFSGRTIRKLPLMALADNFQEINCPDLFISTLVKAADRIKNDRQLLA